MSEVTPEIRVRWEIWRSLLSVLRSYAALAQMTEGIKITVSPEPELVLDTAFLIGEHAEMAISFRPGDGSGHWTLQERQERSPRMKAAGMKRLGQFEMQMDGTLQMDGSPLEPDMAAIEFVAKLVACERSMEGEAVQ